MEIITANITKQHNGKYRVALYISESDGYHMTEKESLSFEGALGYVIMVKEDIEGNKDQ